MTDAELQGFAAQALNMAKRDIEQGEFNFLLASYHEGDKPPIHRMSQIEKLIVERLGENWLNSGRTKDLGFFILRKAVDLLPPDALVFVVVGNRFRTTEKFLQLTVEQQEDLMNANHNRHHQAVQEGLMAVCDSLSATAQTPQRVCVYVQDFERGGFVGKPETMIRPQEDFEGRLKMFGSKGQNERQGQRR